MKNLGAVIVGVILAVVQGVAWAQIYETRDEHGNPVFSDEPVNNNSSEIDLTETNIADTPSPIPTEERPSGPKTKTDTAVTTSGKPAFQDPEEELWEERVRRQKEFDRAKSSSARHEDLDAETRHEVLDAAPRHEELDAEPRREVLDAEPRKEVMDAEPRHEVKDAEPRHEVGDF